MPDSKTAHNYKRHGSRYKARRRAADLLYEAEVRDVDPVALIAERVDLSRYADNQVAPVAEYTKTIVAGVAAELDYLDTVIAEHLAEDWELDRITAVDRAVLRVGLWELLWNPEVPIPTAVSDAVEIASQYSTDSSPSYINALLDAIAKNIDKARDQALHQEEYAAAAAAEQAAKEAAAVEEASTAEDAIPAGELGDPADFEDTADAADLLDAALDFGTADIDGASAESPVAPWDEDLADDVVESAATERADEVSASSSEQEDTAATSEEE
ncbi:MAG: transcription antitermination factor NusB [Corynebacterium sp.]|nr:transcription antitermination factor NusB [Corynebacterium sp.]